VRLDRDGGYANPLELVGVSKINRYRGVTRVVDREFIARVASCQPRQAGDHNESPSNAHARIYVIATCSGLYLPRFGGPLPQVSPYG
jgi:hypothetical protein